MFLAELQERLEAVKGERGNVPLSHVKLMHENTVLVAHDTDHNPDEAAVQAEAAGKAMPGPAIPLEERLQLAQADGPEAILPITVAELTQLLEYREELKQYMDQEGLGFEGKLVQTPCNQYDEQKRGCVRPFGHDGDHVFEAGVTAGTCWARASKAVRNAVEEHVSGTDKPQE